MKSKGRREDRPGRRREAGEERREAARQRGRDGTGAAPRGPCASWLRRWPCWPRPRPQVSGTDPARPGGTDRPRPAPTPAPSGSPARQSGTGSGIWTRTPSRAGQRRLGQILLRGSPPPCPAPPGSRQQRSFAAIASSLAKKALSVPVHGNGSAAVFVPGKAEAKRDLALFLPQVIPLASGGNGACRSLVKSVLPLRP